MTRTFVNNIIFKYRNIDRYIHKKNKHLMGRVNDHHIIPKHLKTHILLKNTNFQVDQNYNLFIMPKNRNLFAQIYYYFHKKKVKL